VSPRQALGVKPLRNAINSTARTAVGIGNQYIGVLAVMLSKYRLQPVGYSLRTIV
jgi:hypothetical protein